MNRSFRSPAARAALTIAALGAGGLLAGTAGAQTAIVQFNAPGIPQAGFPDFVNLNNVNVVFGQINAFQTSIGGHTAPFGDYVLSATATTGYFNYSSSAAAGINNSSFALSAVFNSSGKFVSGSETINGSVPGTTGASQLLYSASFDKFGVSTSTPGLGFETVASSVSGWAKQFQNFNESAYLFAAASLNTLDSALASGRNLPSYFTATVSEITTVPLPASAWLFGPAFAALFGIMRRRNTAGAASA
jgi:hypothetical protein